MNKIIVIEIYLVPNNLKLTKKSIILILKNFISTSSFQNAFATELLVLELVSSFKKAKEKRTYKKKKKETQVADFWHYLYLRELRSWLLSDRAEGVWQAGATA